MAFWNREKSAPAPAGAPAAIDPRVLMEEVDQLRRLGRASDARQRIEQGLRHHPNHVELARAYWEICAQDGTPEAAVRPMLAGIRQLLKTGKVEVGTFYWFEMNDRLGKEPPIDLDLRSLLAEGMLDSGHEESAAELMGRVEGSPDPSLPLPLRIRVARASTRSRAPNAELLVGAVLADAQAPEPVRQELAALLATAKASGLHGAGDADAPIEVSSMGPTVRRMGVHPAVPVAMDGDRITLDFPGAGGAAQRRQMALNQVQAVASARIDSGTEPAYVLIDLVIDSLWEDKEVLRTVRLRTLDFDPMQIVPYARDAQLALGTLLENLLAVSQAQPLPDPGAAVGRPFHAFGSVREYEIQVLAVTP